VGRNNDRGSSTNQSRRAPKDTGRRVKKKPCALCKDRIEWVDYKDVGLLRKYMSDRGKIRARRVSGNCAQHQRDIAMAIKTARELALLPYTQRTTTERPGGRGGRGGREGGGGGYGGGQGGGRGRPRSDSDESSSSSSSSSSESPSVATNGAAPEGQPASAPETPETVTSAPEPVAAVAVDGEG
jgi:small subunit ribosomal protein S18